MGKTFNKLFLRNKIFITLDFIILSIMLFLFLCIKIFYNPIKLNSPILSSRDTALVTPSELTNHNLMLVSTLQMRETLGNNSILSSNDGLMLTRSIYISIIGVLLTIVFSKQNNQKAYVVILSLVVLFYSLDIHISDLIQRSNDSNQITSNALDKVITQRTTYHTWYDIDYSKRNAQYPEIKKARIFRKLNAAFNPDFVQMVFFCFPFLAIYLMSTWNYRKLNNT